MENFGRDWVSEDSPYLRALVTPDLKLRNCNLAWEKVLGYPREMLLGKSLVRLIDQNEHAAALTSREVALYAAAVKRRFFIKFPSALAVWLAGPTAISSSGVP